MKRKLFWGVICFVVGMVLWYVAIQREKSLMAVFLPPIGIWGSLLVLFGWGLLMKAGLEFLNNFFGH
ncbi:MAG: hypothetical protein ACFFG0_42195 [Candidatus Thorarchaeota archaeon]